MQTSSRVSIFTVAATLLCFSQRAEATEYFVDASSGNDSFSGSVAGGGFVPAGCADDGDSSDCGDGPWASLARVANAALAADDVVHLRCGDRWAETLVVQGSNDATRPIRYTSYGTNCDSSPPLLSGAQPLSSWTPDGAQADVYVSENIGVLTTQLLMDGERLTVAREPNLVANTSPYRLITAQSSDISASLTARHYLLDTAYASQVGRDPTGAEIHIRNRRWRLQDRLVTRYEPALGRIGWDDGTQNPSPTELIQCSLVQQSCSFPDSKGLCTVILPDFGYYLANLRWMLDAAHEWHQARATGAISLQLAPGDSPANHLIEASTLDHLVVAQDQLGFIVEDLALESSRLDAVHIVRSSHFTLQRLRVTNSGGNGIYMRMGASNQGAMLHANAISNSSTAAIRSVWGGSDVTITENVISDSGNLDFANPDALDYLSEGRGTGIAIGGEKDFVVASNLIERSGYCGIQVGGSIPGSRLASNRIDRSCLLLDDGGGIYIGGIQGVNDAMLVEENIVSRSVGNRHGVPGSSHAAEGIYLDADCQGVTARDNVVWGVAARGVFLHNAYENTITGNTLYGNGVAIGLYENFTQGLNQAGTMYGNSFGQNTLFQLGPEPTINLTSQYDDFDQAFTFGSFDDNAHGGLYTPRVIAEHYRQGGASVHTSLTLAEWRARRSQAPTSRLQRPVSFAPYRISALTTAHPISNASFDADSASWSCWYPGKTSADACAAPNPALSWEPQCAMKGGCLSLSGSADQYVQASSKNDLAIDGNSAYLLQLMTHATVAAQSGTVALRKTGASYDSLGLTETFYAGQLVSYQKFAFDALESFAAARVDFRVPAGNSLQVDEVMLRGVTLENNDPETNSALIVNTGAQPAALAACEVAAGAVAPSASYVTLEGNAVDWQEILNPADARIVINAHHAFLDSDHDGVADHASVGGVADLCPDTPEVQTSNYEGCSHYQLTGTPCTGVTCEAPPPDACVDGSTLRRYAAVTPCVEGVCVPSFEDIVCEHGCDEAACLPAVPTDAAVVVNDGGAERDAGSTEDSGARGDTTIIGDSAPSEAEGCSCEVSAGPSGVELLLLLVLLSRRRRRNQP